MVEHVESDDGLRHVFKAKTKKTFEEFKKDATFEVKGTWMSVFLGHEWRDGVLHVTSPGARGTVSLDNDVVVTELNAESWPATWEWVRDKMVHDVSRMTEAISEYSNLQAEEFESRTRIRRAAEDKLAQSRDLEARATQALARWEILDDLTRVLVAVTGTGSAFAAWSAQNHTSVLGTTGLVVVTSVAGLATVQAVLKASEQIKHWSELKGHFVRLKNDLESFITDIDIKPDFQVGDFQQRLQGYERRYADGEMLWRTDVLTWFWSAVARVRSAVGSSSSNNVAAPPVT